MSKNGRRSINIKISLSRRQGPAISELELVKLNTHVVNMTVGRYEIHACYLDVSVTYSIINEDS